MTLRDDAILISGFIYGVSANMPIAIRRALERIAITEPVHYLNTLPERVQKDPEIEKITDSHYRINIPIGIPEEDVTFTVNESVEASNEQAELAERAPMQAEESNVQKVNIAKKERKPRAPLSEESKANLRAGLEKARAAKAKKLAGDIIEVSKTSPDHSTVPTKTYTPATPERLIEEHDEYIGKRDAGEGISDEDWPDIQNMLRKKNTVRAIAADYDIPFADMNAFIDRHLLREARESDARKRGGL